MLVDTGSSLNFLPKKALDRLDCEGLTLKPSNIVVRDFDGSKRMVHGEVNIPVKIGSQTFESNFYVMDIRPSYSCLMGRPWIHKAGALTSTLHQMLKYPMKGKIVIVYGEDGEEEYMVSHLNSFRYVEMDGEFIETPCQNFEEVPQILASTETTTSSKPPLKMASLNDARAVVEEGAQRNVRRTREGGPPLHISNRGVDAIEDNEED